MSFMGGRQAFALLLSYGCFDGIVLGKTNGSKFIGGGRSRQQRENSVSGPRYIFHPEQILDFEQPLYLVFRPLKRDSLILVTKK